MTTTPTYFREAVAAAPTEAAVRIVSRPYEFDGSRPAIVHGHGYGQTAASAALNPSGQRGQWDLFRGLVERTGCPFIIHDLGGGGNLGSGWGGANHLSRIADVVAYAQDPDRLAGATDRVILTGASMGVLGDLNYAKANPDLVAAIVGVIPAVDLDDFYDVADHGLPFDDDVAAAHGVTWPTALPAGVNPFTSPGALSTIPVLLASASDDGTAPAASAEAMVALCGDGSEFWDVGALGHTDAAIAAADIDDIVLWLQGVGAL